MHTPLYILVFCIGSHCAPHTPHPWMYTLSRQRCIEQMHEAHRQNKDQIVRCESKGGWEMILDDGTSRYRSE